MQGELTLSGAPSPTGQTSLTRQTLAVRLSRYAFRVSLRESFRVDWLPAHPPATIHAALARRQALHREMLKSFGLTAPHRATQATIVRRVPNPAGHPKAKHSRLRMTCQNALDRFRRNFAPGH